MTEGRSSIYEMVDEVAVVVETIVRLKKKCNDLEETPKELFSSSWIANANPTIMCVILSSSLTPRPTCKTLKFWKTPIGARSSKFYGIDDHSVSRLNLDSR